MTAQFVPLFLVYSVEAFYVFTLEIHAYWHACYEINRTTCEQFNAVQTLLAPFYISVSHHSYIPAKQLHTGYLNITLTKWHTQLSLTK